MKSEASQLKSIWSLRLPMVRLNSLDHGRHVSRSWQSIGVHVIHQYPNFLSWVFNRGCIWHPYSNLKICYWYLELQFMSLSNCTAKKASKVGASWICVATCNAVTASKVRWHVRFTDGFFFMNCWRLELWFYQKIPERWLFHEKVSLKSDSINWVRQTLFDSFFFNLKGATRRPPSFPCPSAPLLIPQTRICKDYNIYRAWFSEKWLCFGLVRRPKQNQNRSHWFTTMSCVFSGCVFSLYCHVD